MGFPKGVTKITSTGLTVTITKPTGPTTNLEVVAGVGTISSLTGDVTASGTGAVAATLVATTNVKNIINAQVATPGVAPPSLIYGDGSDGAQVFDGSTTILGIVPSSNIYILARDIYLTNVTINTGITVNTDGYRIFINGTLTFGGAGANISNNGGPAAGTNGANGGLGGGVSATYGKSGQTGPSGGTGNGNQPAVLANCLGGNGGAGGNGAASTGGATRVNTPPAATAGSIHSLPSILTANSSPAPTAANGWQGGGAGSAGGGDATNNGGGGGGGGPVLVVAWKIVGTGAIQSRGGQGGIVTVSTLGAGGGGGGAGGLVVVISTSVVAGAITGIAIDANGGPPGTGLGTTFTVATAGAAGTVVVVNSP